MVLDVANKLGVSNQPVIKDMLLFNGLEVTAVGLSRGVAQYFNGSTDYTKMLVIKGEVDFNTDKVSKRFACFESYDIPKDCIHSIEAYDDAIVILFKIKQNKNRSRS
jgi:hypothetical protein